MFFHRMLFGTCLPFSLVVRCVLSNVSSERLDPFNMEHHGGIRSVSIPAMRMRRVQSGRRLV